MVPPRPHKTSLLWGCLVRVCSDGGMRGCLGGDDMMRVGLIFATGETVHAVMMLNVRVQEYK